jgi:hypothetical protein
MTDFVLKQFRLLTATKSRNSSTDFNCSFTQPSPYGPPQRGGVEMPHEGHNSMRISAYEDQVTCLDFPFGGFKATPESFDHTL